ncbi:MAG: hypothetical protein ABI339_02995 [Solirubrobacteraceae bacterium]
MLAVFTAIAALALAGVSLAATTAKHVTGGTATMTITPAASTALSNHHMTITPIAPATASGSTLTFPISGGRVNAKLHGHLAFSGGFTISNGTQTVQLRRLRVVSNASGVFLRARVAKRVHNHNGHFRVEYSDALIARVTGVHVSHGTGTGTGTGTVRLTSASASVINKLAGTKIARRGTPVATGTVTPTTT